MALQERETRRCQSSNLDCCSAPRESVILQETAGRGRNIRRAFHYVNNPHFHFFFFFYFFSPQILASLCQDAVGNSIKHLLKDAGDEMLNGQSYKHETVSSHSEYKHNFSLKSHSNNLLVHFKRVLSVLFCFFYCDYSILRKNKDKIV